MNIKLNILKNFNKLLKKNFHYFLIYGTLGAQVYFLGYYLK